mgnify:CR=1 FL=1
MDVLKVSAKSIPNSVAGAIAGVIREKGAVEIQAIGAGAANQAIKSIAIARGYFCLLYTSDAADERPSAQAPQIRPSNPSPSPVAI